MKKGKILNRSLNNAISVMGHTDVLMITDAGYPIPQDVVCVDLAITQDIPSVISILELLLSDFIYEKCVVAEEQKLYNPLFHKKVTDLIDRCPVETVPHTDIIGSWREQAKVMIRTGGLEPWGNIVLVSGINAAAYFEKEGAIAPDYYKKRIEYQEQ